MHPRTLPILLLAWCATAAPAQGAGLQFLPHSDFQTGSLPISVAVGDLNGDGNLDLAVANVGSNAVSILLGTGTGGFQSKADFTADNGPHAVAIGDMNGDGKLDLVIANYQPGTVSILLGTGSGAFGPPTQVVTGSRPYSVALADLNGDGKLDLATANNAANTVSVMLGDGAGGVASRADFATGSTPSCVVIRDLNGDGKPDLVVTNEDSGTISVLLGTGGGVFGPKSDIPTGSSPWAVVAGDLNGDGIPDLAVTNYYSNTVSVLKGDGLGGFGSKVDFPSSPGPRALAVGDVDGDGKLDLVVPNDGVGTVSVFLGDGAGGSTSRNDFVTGPAPYSAAIGDFNGDGRADLVAANLSANTVSLLLQVNPGSPTSCTLTASPSPSVFGQAVALAANVTPNTATGGVNFLDGLQTLGTASLNSGTAALSVSGLTTGIHSLAATYTGDVINGFSTSPVVLQTVNKAATTIVASASLNPSVFSDTVTFTATLSVTAPGAGHPTGTVQFTIDGVAAGSAVGLDAAGMAHLTTTALAGGVHAVVAIYGGDGNFEGSTSASLNQAVTPPNPVIVGVRDVPNDQGGHVFLTWHSPLDRPGGKTVTGYRVWRRAPNPGVPGLRAAIAGAAGSQSETSHARVMRTVLPDGPTLDGYWEAMATLPAEQLINYAYEAATTQDSMPESNPNTAFFITALTADPFVYFSSAPDSGYSVDNLSPPTPAPFAALYLQGSTELHWASSPAPDFREFRLYRGISAEFVPGPANLVIATADTDYVDISPTPYVYKLAATDKHDNQSRYAMVTPNGPVATLAAFIAVEAQPDRIRLTWYAAGNPGLVATVYRRGANTTWTSLGAIATDGTGYLRYEDTSVQTGVKYGYRLGIMDAGSEVFVGEAWATAERLVFELAGARPNPTVAGQLTVFFTLPTAGAAKLDLLDVSGRRWTTREVGSLGPGGHSVNFSEGGRIPPGIYLTRLTQGGHSLTRRVVVLP